MLREDNIPVWCINPPDPPGKQARFLFRHDDEKDSDKEGVGIPKVYALMTVTRGYSEIHR